MEEAIYIEILDGDDVIYLKTYKFRLKFLNNEYVTLLSLPASKEFKGLPCYTVKGDYNIAYVKKSRQVYLHDITFDSYYVSRVDQIVDFIKDLPYRMHNGIHCYDVDIVKIFLALYAPINPVCINLNSVKTFTFKDEPLNAYIKKLGNEILTNTNKEFNINKYYHLLVEYYEHTTGNKLLLDKDKVILYKSPIIADYIYKLVKNITSLVPGYDIKCGNCVSVFATGRICNVELLSINTEEFIEMDNVKIVSLNSFYKHPINCRFIYTCYDYSVNYINVNASVYLAGNVFIPNLCSQVEYLVTNNADDLKLAYEINPFLKNVIFTTQRIAEDSIEMIAKKYFKD